MASLVIVAIVVVAAGALFGAYIKICFAIRRDDRVKYALRADAPSRSAQNARALVGISGYKRD